MQMSELFQKYPRPDKLPRVAELAALILSKSVTVHLKTEPGAHMGAPSRTTGVERDMMAPFHAAYVADMLVKRAERLHKLAEADCNIGLSEAQERTVEKIEGEVIEIAEAVGFKAKTGGDPRGAVVVLFDPQDERAGDGWGGGWPVYR